jgi:hypothetical protein
MSTPSSATVRRCLERCGLFLHEDPTPGLDGIRWWVNGGPDWGCEGTPFCSLREVWDWFRSHALAALNDDRRARAFADAHLRAEAGDRYSLEQWADGETHSLPPAFQFVSARVEHFRTRLPPGWFRDYAALVDQGKPYMALRAWLRYLIDSQQAVRLGHDLPPAPSGGHAAKRL